jgi:hypothetical protein
MIKARTVKQVETAVARDLHPLLSLGSGQSRHDRKNKRVVGSGVLLAVHAEAM